MNKFDFSTVRLKTKFVCLFFGRIRGYQKLFWNYLTFRIKRAKPFPLNYLFLFGPLPLSYSEVLTALDSWSDAFYVVSVELNRDSAKFKVAKVHIFWEGHKILRNLPLTFNCSTYSQKSKVKISQNFVAFSEYMNFIKLIINKTYNYNSIHVIKISNWIGA